MIHGSLNGLAFLAYFAALAIMYYLHRNSGHFGSIHGKAGIVTYAVLMVQAAIGFTMYVTPSLYGGMDNAKAVWKYHRMSGYVVATLALGTVAAATQTTYNQNVLHINLWVVLVCDVLVLAGLLPRVKLQKLGMKTS